MSAIRSALSDFARRHVRALTLAFVAGLFMAMIGAFETDTVSFELRLAYWAPVMLFGGLAAAVIGDRISLRSPLWRGVAVTALMSIPIIGFVCLAMAVVFGHRFQPAWIIMVAPGVVVVSAAYVAVAWFLERPAAVDAGPAPAPRAAEAAGPAFLKRLPGRFAQAGLLAVEAEDHYLRVHTREGSTLLLMRLADALDQLRGTPGLQVHRSWWVADVAVERLDLSRGRGRVTLVGGVAAPVSASYARAARVRWGRS